MAVTTLQDRAILRLSGEDVRGFLQGLVTNDVEGPLPVWAGLLTPQGKALFDFLVWADGDPSTGSGQAPSTGSGQAPSTGSGQAFLIDCEAAQAEALAKRLALYRLRRPIVIARDDTLAVHWAPDGAEGVADPRLPALGRRWLAPATAGDASPAWRAHRHALGVTEGAEELGQDRTLWLEANAGALNGVSFTKGCYVGQENTARMHHRGKVARRLVVVRGDPDPADSAAIRYPELGLAVVRARADALPATAIVPDWLIPSLERSKDG